MAESWMADVKAALAREGLSVAPDSKLQTIDKPAPGTGAAIIVLERVRADYLPDYCVHGYASCVTCDEMCYLGSETAKIVEDGGAYPLCLQCAAQQVPQTPGGPQLLDTIKDHLRGDGPHD